MSFSGHLVESYFARTGQPRDGRRDAAYAYQWAVLRDMLARLEVILDDEDVPRETAERVLRCLLYGAPSAADADERMERHAEMAKLMARVPPAPMFFPGAADQRPGRPITGGAMSWQAGRKNHEELTQALGSIARRLTGIETTLGEIMTTQNDIDTATQAILGLVTSIQAEDTTLGTAVTAIQGFIAAQPAGADTTALDAAVAQISGAQASLGTAVSSVSSLVPVQAAPPASPPAA